MLFTFSSFYLIWSAMNGTVMNAKYVKLLISVQSKASPPKYHVAGMFMACFAYLTWFEKGKKQTKCAQKNPLLFANKVSFWVITLIK